MKQVPARKNTATSLTIPTTPDSSASVAQTPSGSSGPAEPATFDPALPGTNYGFTVTVFVALLLISNVAAVKLISFGGLIFDGGVFLFPLVYITGDVLAEVHGFKAARRATLLAFVLSAVMTVTLLLTQISPSAPGWNNQAAFEAILGFVPRIVAASLAAFLVGQLSNAWVLTVLKKLPATRRFLRVRLIGSTIVGQLLDTTVFCAIAFWGVLQLEDFILYTALGYAIKVLAEVVLLPVTTRVIRVVKKV